MARPIAREAAMQLVFEQLFGGDATAQTLVDLIDYNPNEKDSTYIDTVVGGVKEHADELDSEISACLRGWTLARLSRVDLAIMRLAVYEMQYTGLPAAVAINEAGEFTRKDFGGGTFPVFKGGVGSIRRKLGAPGRGVVRGSIQAVTPHPARWSRRRGRFCPLPGGC